MQEEPVQHFRADGSPPKLSPPTLTVNQEQEQMTQDASFSEKHQVLVSGESGIGTLQRPQIQKAQNGQQGGSNSSSRSGSTSDPVSSNHESMYSTDGLDTATGRCQGKEGEALLQGTSRGQDKGWSKGKEKEDHPKATRRRARRRNW